MSGEADIRKARSEALLAARSIPINPHLPVIETATEASFRDGEEVMRRAMCLFAVSRAATDDNAAESIALLQRWQLMDALSPAERSFLGADPLPERARARLSWRCEALIPLMWSTGLIDEMPFPDGPFDFACLAEFWETVPGGYWQNVGIRDAGEILDEADLIYRLHWASRDAALKSEKMPGGLHPGVVSERHHALNWLIGYDAAEWDDVSTDT